MGSPPRTTKSSGLGGSDSLPTTAGCGFFRTPKMKMTGALAFLARWLFFSLALLRRDFGLISILPFSLSLPLTVGRGWGFFFPWAVFSSWSVSLVSCEPSTDRFSSSSSALVLALIDRSCWSVILGIIPRSLPRADDAEAADADDDDRLEESTQFVLNHVRPERATIIILGSIGFVPWNGGISSPPPVSLDWSPSRSTFGLPSWCLSALLSRAGYPTPMWA